MSTNSSSNMGVVFLGRRQKLVGVPEPRSTWVLDQPEHLCTDRPCRFFLFSIFGILHAAGRLSATNLSGLQQDISFTLSDCMWVHFLDLHVRIKEIFLAGFQETDVLHQRQAANRRKRHIPRVTWVANGSAVLGSQVSSIEATEKEIISGRNENRNLRNHRVVAAAVVRPFAVAEDQLRTRTAFHVYGGLGTANKQTTKSSSPSWSSLQNRYQYSMVL